MTLIDQATQMLLAEAAIVMEIADGGPTQASSAVRAGATGAGATAGGLLAGPVGAAVGGWLGSKVADGLWDAITGAGNTKAREMRQAARRVAGRWAELLGRAVLNDMARRGLMPLFDTIAGGEPVTRWSDNLGEDLTPLRGVPRGAGQEAARVYMDAAAPYRLAVAPFALTSSPAWQLMASVWGGFDDTCTRQAAVMTAIDERGGLPDPAAGVAAMRRAYAEQMGQLEQTGGLFGSVATGNQSNGRPARTKPAKRVDNPKVKQKTIKKKSKGGGGAALLAGGLLLATGTSIAAASLSKRKARKKRSRR